MTQGQQLAKSLKEVILNGKRIAYTNYKQQIETLSFQEATHKINTLNTVNVLAQHVHYYINGVNDALSHGTIAIKDAYSFDFPLVTSEQQWQNFLFTFWNDTHALATILEKMSDEALRENFVEEKYGSIAQNIQMMIEHAYYHLGQIVLINKLTNQNGI